MQLPEDTIALIFSFLEYPERFKLSLVLTFLLNAHVLGIQKIFEIAREFLPLEQSTKGPLYK